MKTEFTINYESEDCPISEGGDLRVDRDNARFAIESHLFEIVRHDQEKHELVVALDIPSRPCRFLDWADGRPPACYGFGNAEKGTPAYMEENYAGQAPEIVCFHCAEYACGGYEARQQPKEEVLDRHGHLWLLPELDEAAEGVPYIDRNTGTPIR